MTYLTRNNRALTYSTAGELLGNRQFINVCHATSLHRLDDNAIGLKYHSTFVIVWNRNGSIQLSSGGWHTVTTKSRINDFLDYGIARLYQSEFHWFLALKNDKEGLGLSLYNWENPVDFYDGIVINK